MDHYEKIVRHYENIINQQAKQIELLQQVLTSGQRAGDPADIDPAQLRVRNPF